jgi:putative ABC transport system permease protein
MLAHYLTTAVRSLKRDSHFGVINIIGLAIALAAAILIILFIRDELSYDNWGPETA